MNLLYITPTNLSKPGGATSHVTGFCKGMSALGTEIKIVSPYSTQKDSGVPSRGILRRIDHMQRLCRVRYQIIQCIKSGWPDAIYYRKGIIDIGIFFAFRHFNGPVYLEINGNVLEDSKGLIKYLMTRTSAMGNRIKLMNARRIISVSAGIKESLLKRYPGLSSEKIIVVNNGIDEELFKILDKTTCRKKLGIDDDKFVAVFAGKIAEWHGLEATVDALSLLKAKYSERIRFYIVGDGPAAMGLIKKVAAVGLQNMIIFTGMQKVDRVAAYIGAADVCLAPFTAKRNNIVGISPLKIFEYVACGRPVITTNVKGIREIVDEVGDGGQMILIRPEDSGELAETLEKIINLQSTNISEINVSRLKKRISWTARARTVYNSFAEDLA